MRLPRFQRFLGCGYTQAEWDEFYEEERRKRDEEWWAGEERRKKEEDIRRGHWVVSPRLTSVEEQEWEAINFNNSLWTDVKKTEDGQSWWERVCNDPVAKARFDVLDKKRQEHIDTDNYARCRLPPIQYYQVKEKVLQDGIGTRWVRFETASDGFKYLRVHFPDDYQWLLNNETGKAQQRTNPAGLHITICDWRKYEGAAKEATDALEANYWQWQEIEMKEISVSTGDTYQIEGNSQFAQDLRETVAITMRHKGAGYKAHISMD